MEKKKRPYRRLKERMNTIREADKLLCRGYTAKEVMRKLKIGSDSTLCRWRTERRECRAR